MKSFIYKTAFLSMMVLSTLVLVNYTIDSAKLYSHEYEVRLATILDDGNYVTNVSNYDDRLFQKERIIGLKTTPEIIVLGSSRTMLLNHNDLGTDKLRNSSVSGASIEDLIAIYQLYKSTDKLPAKIILGIDPWVFNAHSNQNRWESISTYYYEYMGVDELANNQIEKYKQLVSFSYFQSSMDNLSNFIEGNDIPVATKKVLNEMKTILLDGSLVYERSYRESSVADVQKRVENNLSGTIYGLAEMDSISESIWSDFEGLIGDMNKQGVEVEIFITPYHPLVYERLERDYELVLTIEDRLKAFCSQNSIKMYGSYNPKQYSLTERDFYDGMHCNGHAIQLILEKGNMN